MVHCFRGRSRNFPVYKEVEKTWNTVTYVTYVTLRNVLVFWVNYKDIRGQFFKCKVMWVEMMGTETPQNRFYLTPGYACMTLQFLCNKYHLWASHYSFYWHASQRYQFNCVETFQLQCFMVFCQWVSLLYQIKALLNHHRVIHITTKHHIQYTKFQSSLNS